MALARISVITCFRAHRLSKSRNPRYRVGSGCSWDSDRASGQNVAVANREMVALCVRNPELH